MENRKLVSLLFLVGLFVFHLLFWKESQGLNTFFFAVFSIGALSMVDVSRWKSTYFKITAIGTLLLSAFVVLNNSETAIICFWLSWVLMIGVAATPSLYYLLYALTQGLENIFAVPSGLSSHWKETKVESSNYVPASNSGLRPSLFIIPMAIVFLFIGLYMIGNREFAQNIGRFFAAIFKNLDWLWDLLSLRWMLFMGAGIFVIGALFWKSGSERWANAQISHVFNIQKGDIIPNMSQINDRFWIAFLTLAMLNVLILIVNVQDFATVGDLVSSDASGMKYSVHFGTFVLILSIIVAMFLLFYFFKKDLNFIEKAPQLRLLAYIWIAQNAVMVITVGVRNYLYISHYGLAYKRIGVIFFLLLVLFGLFTMVLKVKNLRTFSYLFHLNTWAVYVIFVLISAVNWDNFITNFNLNHNDSDKLDAAFLIEEVSDKNLKTLFENKYRLPAKISYKERGWFSDNSYDKDMETLLNQKRDNFLGKMQNKKSIFSWNLPDDENKRFFEK